MHSLLEEVTRQIARALAQKWVRLHGADQAVSLSRPLETIAGVTHQDTLAHAATPSVSQSQ